MISICKNCTTEFRTLPSRVGNYCSVSCARKGTARKRRNQVAVSCEYCNKEFKVWPCLIRKGHGRFCSRTCRMLSADNPVHNPGVKDKIIASRRANPTRYWLGKKRNMPWLVPDKGASAPMKGRENLKIQGANHWNWKGGISPRPLSSLRYKQWRSSVFERDDYTCQMCGQRGGYLEVDHIKRWVDYPKLRFVIGNGRTLCKPCHKQVTFGVVRV